MPSIDFLESLSASTNQNLSKVSEEALASLRSTSYVESAQQAAAQEAQRRQALLAEDTDNPLSYLTNVAASALAGVSETVGYVASAPVGLGTMDLLTVSDEAKAAYIRYRNAKDSGTTYEGIEKDEALLNQKIKRKVTPTSTMSNTYTYGVDVAPETQSVKREGSKTNLEAIEYGLGAANLQKDIKDFFNLDSIVNKENQDVITKAAEVADTKFAVTLDTAISKIKEGKVLDGVSDIASGAADAVFDTFDKVEDPLDAAKAVGELTAEVIGGVALGLLGKTGSALQTVSSIGYGSDAFATAIVDFQEKNGRLPTTEELQKQLKLASSLTLAEQAGDLFALGALTKGRKALDAAAKVSTTSLTEAATEAYQTIVEESLIKLEEPDYKGAFTSGLMGALAGGGAASVRPTIEAAKAVTGKAGEAVTNKVKNTEFVQKRKVQKEAIETGNLEPVTNTELPTFDLNTSVDTLAKRNEVEGVTPEERTQNYETAKEQVLSKQAELVQLTNEYVELESKTERTPEEQARLQELDTLVPKLEESISKAAPIVRAMRPTVVDAEQVSNDIEAATKNDTEAARRVFGSFRDNPTTLSESQAIALADADNGLTEEENQILKTYAEVQKNLRTVSQVSDNIINGGTDPQTKRKMLGIKDYQNMILSGDEDIKTKGLEGLKLFAERQTSKAIQLEDALVKATNTGKPVQVGSLKISNNSKRLVSKVREEANLLNQVYQQYSSIPSVEPTVQKPTEEDTTEQPIVDTGGDQTVQEVTQPQQPEVVSETVEKVTDTPVQPSVVTPVEAEASPVTTIVEPALDIAEDKDYSLAKELTNKEGNLVSEYFKPSNKQSALNKIANFSSKLKLDTENTLKQFYGSVVPTGAMEVATEFTKFNDSFNKALDEIFAAKEEFIGNDFTQYLVDESGNLPENVKTAMAVGAYQWIVSSGKESNYQSEESMRGLLGLSDEDYVEPELYNLIPKGVRFQSVVNSMGTAAFKTLNLKLDNNAPIDAQTNLETSLGLWAYSALENSGVLKESESVTGAQIKSLYGSEAPDSIKKLGDRTTFQLVQLDLTNDIDNIFAANKKQSSFMQDVFGSSYERPMPSFKPVKGNLKVAKSTQQVPESQKRVLEADQAKPYFFRENTVQTFFGFNPELQKEMMGYVSNLDTVIDVNKPSVEGKNRSIERELEIAQEWYEEVQDKGINTPFYLEHTVWKQGRMGIGNKFNPQASKIHRYLVNREWNTTFTFGSPEENFFLLAVGEGLDIEVPKFGSDQNGLASDKALEEVQKQLDKPEVRNAIDAMKDVLRLSGERELPVELQTVIADGVKAIRTNMKGYLSIVAMAEYELAKESGATEFTHNLAREVDGITNGVAITTLQFATDNVEAMFNMLQRMGIYNSNITYNEWIANPANQDSYKTLARDWEKAIQLKAMSDAKYAKDYNVVSKLFGSFIKVNELTGKEEVTKQGRNIAKNPLMTSIYGASIGTIADNIGSQGIEKVYERLETVYKGLIERTLTQEAARAEVNEVLSIVNYLTGSKRVIRNTKDLKEFKLKPNEVKNFKKVVSGIYQNPLKEAMDKEYKVSFDSRNKLNAAANLAHALFVNMYNKRKAEILKQTGNKQLTVEEEKNLVESLKTVTPIVNTATSKISSKDLTKQLDTGLMLSGYEMTPITDRSVQVTINPKNLKSGKKSRTTNGQLRTFSEPGAAAIPTMTQSIDAATQVSIINNATILNVHDASYIDGNKFGSTKETYNKGFLMVNSLYSIPQEIGVMLNRVVTGFDGDSKDLEEPIVKAAKTVLGRDAKWVAQRGLQQTLNDINSFITGLGQDHVNNKNKVMNNIVRSEQYSNGEDSAYVREVKQVKEITVNTSNTAFKVVENDLLTAIDNMLAVTQNQDYKLILNAVKKFKLDDITLVVNPNLKSVAKYQERTMKSMGKLKTLRAIQIKDVNSNQLEEALVHELIHAITANAINNPKTAKEVMLVKRLKAIQSKLPRQPLNGDRLTKQYLDIARIEIAELVTYGLTNRGVQDTLKNIVGTESSSLWGDFVTSVRKFLGLNTDKQSLLSDLLYAFEDYTTNNNLGSSAYTDIRNDFTFDEARRIDGYNSEQVFDELQQVSLIKDEPEHLEYLRSVLNNVVNKVIQPFDLYLGASDQTETIGATDGVDMFIVNQTQGSQPLSGSLANGIRMSASEVFVHELVHNVSMFGIDNKYAERNELYKLWLQAKKVVTVRDFMNDPSMLESDPRFADEYQAAEQRYKHVFEPRRDTVVNGRAKSNYLHEFVALGLTNNNFRKALSKIEYQNKASEMNTATGSLGRLVQGIYNWFNKLLNTLNAKLLSTYGKPVDQQLAQLFQSFAGIDSSNKAQLRKHMERATEVFTRPVQEVINRVQPGIERNLVQPLDKFKKLSKKQIKEAVKNGKVQTVTEITNETYNKLRQSNSTAANLFLSLVTESKGRFNAVAVLHDMKRLANKNIDRYRMQVRNDYRTAINEAFAEKLTVQEKDALSHAFLKTDITSLLNDFSQDQIIELMRDKQYLAQTIQQYETNLNQYTGYTAFYIRQAKNLGKFMITGVSSIPNGLMNAKNIADAIGTPRTMPKFARQAEPTIDVLASLYAISNLSDNHRRLINGLVSKEVSRTDGGNGITFTINLLKEFRSKTLEEFKENSRHIQKGFMTDKVNPDIAIKVGTIDDQEEFEAQGYAIGSALPKDPSDPDTETKYLFVNGHGGQPANIGGVAYLLNDAARGTSVTLNTTGSFNGSSTGTLDTWKTKNAKKVSANWNKRTLDSTTYAVPLVNEAGEIVDYRYVMNDNTKNDILQRDTSFDDIMGIMFSGLAVKNDIKRENKELVKVLKEMYTNTPNRAEFVEISPQSTNEEYREIFRLLPEDMKEEIRRVWGSDSMLVRKDSVDLLFGYHKYTAANLWKLSKAERGLVQEAFVMFVNMIFGKKAAMRVRQGEELLEALAKTVKDIIVIKTGVVTLGNMVSNMVLLKMMGVPIKDIIAGHKDSFTAMREYKKLNQETEQVRLKLSNANLTRAQRSVYESKLVQLEDRLANNPVIDLIDAGLLSTIVEDVDTEVQEYKLSQRIKRKYAETSWAERLEDATNRIPNSVKDVFKEALVMQGSNLYGFLSEAAQFSDFGARYVLFQHMTKNKGIAKDEAAGQVMDIFIDYDLPTHKGIQYLNDLGLLMFSKYLVRVQRIIAKTFLENPARALSIMLLQNFFGDVPDIMDSTMIIETNPLTRLANPVESFINAAPDIITAKVFS
ncbi:virion RNA polymerase [Vibrio phage phi 1]|uniref:Viron-encapsulated RNA polymerase n=1 Tax=Vibrio phage phi 1 TaxID=1589297 RepID=A0A0B5H2N7_9CAUD|nr:virion RNA polymerase [Vibrio phage phi 1]AJF40732.1 viron-encapsulated RNA polymerase [Vibrio phage phi 1]